MPQHDPRPTGHASTLPGRVPFWAVARRDIDKLHNEIEELLSDKAALESMGEAGFQAWKSRFTWENIAAQYEQVYKVW